MLLQEREEFILKGAASMRLSPRIVISGSLRLLRNSHRERAITLLPRKITAACVIHPLRGAAFKQLHRFS
jgi:hypothetical protein